MGMEEENQEFLGAIVEDCLGSIEEDSRSQDTSSINNSSARNNGNKNLDEDDDDEEKKNEL